MERLIRVLSLLIITDDFFFFSTAISFPLDTASTDMTERIGVYDEQNPYESKDLYTVHRWCSINVRSVNSKRTVKNSKINIKYLNLVTILDIARTRARIFNVNTTERERLAQIQKGKRDRTGKKFIKIIRPSLSR